MVTKGVSGYKGADGVVTHRETGGVHEKTRGLVVTDFLQGEPMSQAIYFLIYTMYHIYTKATYTTEL